jgi:hypothetical protein
MLKYKDIIGSKSDAEYSIGQSIRMTTEEASEIVSKLAKEAHVDMLVDDWINLANWLSEKYVKFDVPYRMLNLYIKTIPLRNSFNGNK